MNGAYKRALRALYGGRSEAEVKEHKGVAPNKSLSARMTQTEAAASLFCLTQTEERLKRGGSAENGAEVGAKVRQTSAELGGRMPEDLSLKDERKSSHERRTRKRGKTPDLPE